MRLFHIKAFPTTTTSTTGNTPVTHYRTRLCSGENLGSPPSTQGRNMGTRAYLPAAQGRNACREFPSPETGAVCPALGTEGEGGNWPFSWNFCSHFFPGRKKKNLKQFWLPSLPSQDNQPVPRVNLLRPQTPFSSGSFPKDSAIWSCFACAACHSLRLGRPVSQTPTHLLYFYHPLLNPIRCFCHFLCPTRLCCGF